MGPSDGRSPAATPDTGNFQSYDYWWDRRTDEVLRLPPDTGNFQSYDYWWDRRTDEVLRATPTQETSKAMTTGGTVGGMKSCGYPDTGNFQREDMTTYSNHRLYVRTFIWATPF